MAKVDIGSLLVDMNSPQLYPFPSVDLKRNKGFIFYLRSQTPPVALEDRGYFLVIPLMNLNGLLCERPLLCKWFPKAFEFAFKVSVPEKFGDPVPTTIALYPITPFRNFIGSNPQITLSWEDNEEENSILNP